CPTARSIRRSGGRFPPPARARRATAGGRTRASPRPPARRAGGRPPLRPCRRTRLLPPRRRTGTASRTRGLCGVKSRQLAPEIRKLDGGMGRVPALVARLGTRPLERLLQGLRGQ